MLPPAEINYAVEGIVDAAVARRLITHCGGALGLERVMGGKSRLDPVIERYAQSARFLPWFILRDMDHDADCGPALRFNKLAANVEYLCFRIAIRSVEAWLLADRASLVQFLRIPASQMPEHPEALANPKTTIVNLGRRSASLNVRRAIVPREGAGASEGPEYAAFMVEFAGSHWRPEVANKVDPHSSLSRAIRCLTELAGRARTAQS
jgi:hypothetical protein